MSEYYGTPISENKDFIADKTNILRIFYQIANGLAYMNQKGFVFHNLEPTNILVDSLCNVKLFNYGLFHMTNEGDYVSFPIGYEQKIYRISLK